MLANLFFRDVFAQINAGIPPQTLATGTTSGSAIQLGGPSPLGKLFFQAIFASASAAASATMYLMTATASAGAYTSISNTVVSLAIATTSVGSSMYELFLDTRNEAFGNLLTNASWVKVVLTLTGGTIPFALNTLGWESGVDPARNYDSASILLSETDFY